ncbi:methyl-accepting chemotaxis protein [Pseudoalteromonas piscicida]|uniref:methyl-accepting chemotaxis protein n=1 Tax=Pseudoalteromonas piscicida TaxID=43662 RepID=UPI001EFD6511|nr:PAS domain-containing methyl-accepting chemotaxis protein [Pseudoalteromonas piscicida]MCG9769244.1 methyl-accepting chemotaxis protein [Pseudoalteromonas piscicida]
MSKIMGREIKLGKHSVLLSTTDLDSRITYANQSFCDIAGFSIEEMLGQPHNLVRNQDMPKAAFRNMWSTIQNGQSWMGPVKNLTKNGDYYWVNAFVTPIKDERGNIVEYQSVRTCPSPEVIKRAENAYRTLDSQQKTSRYDSTRLSFMLLLFVAITLPLASLLNNHWFTLLPLTLLCITIALTARFRSKYKALLTQAKTIFDNDLMSVIYGQSRDRVADITLALEMQKAKISAVVGRVNDVSVRVSENAKLTTQSGQFVAELLKQQTSEAKEMVVCMDEFSQTIDELSENVNHAADAANNSEHQAGLGKAAVKDVIDSIHYLDEHLMEVNNAVNRLVSGNDRIQNILSVINSIADQTNLLALNAAIEAARAGDHGRGFSVVADEVRTLAQRTQTSTEEITQLLKELNDISSSAVESVQKSNSLSNQSVDLAKNNGSSLDTIQSHVMHLADLNRSVAAAIEQQSCVVKQISINVDSVTTLAERGTEHGEKSFTLSQELLSQIEQQTRLIQQFSKT